MSITKSQLSLDFTRMLTKSNVKRSGDVKFTAMPNTQRDTQRGFIGRRVTEVRTALGYTQSELATQVSGRFPDSAVTPSTISLIESGSRNPSIDLAFAIATVLETSMDYLTGMTDYDRGVNGHDEVTVVVHSQEQKQDMQDIVYPFLNLSADDRRMVIRLVNRLSADSSAVDAMTLQERRFRNVIATLAEKLGADTVRDITEAFGIT